MNKIRWIQKAVVLLGVVVGGIVPAVYGQGNDSLTYGFARRFIHGLSLEGRPEYVFPTHSFLRGENPERKIIRGASSAHLKYAFRYRPGSDYDRIYGGVYQGIGLGVYSFGEPGQMGNPVAFYLFQGARIAKVCPWLSFNYEWNFGLSTGWKPYDAQYNSYNKMVGSKINAYINANFYFRWSLTPQVSLTSGITLTHFSNGNTSFPNAGVNTVGGKFGVEYNFYRPERPMVANAVSPRTNLTFHRHVSYDFVFFGSWRRKGIWIEGGQLPLPESYPVFGFNFAPMYNLDYKLRLGLSLDGVYDGSANLYIEDGVYGDDMSQVRRPALYHQFALGLSGRVEYVMPFFTVGIGMGTNFIGKGDLRAFYQLLALKIALSRDTFLHVGYNIQDFHEPNFLMLGIGFRFNSKYAAF